METHNFTYYLHPIYTHNVIVNPPEDIPDMRDSSEWRREEFTDNLTVSIYMVFYSDSIRHQVEVKHEYIFAGEFTRFKDRIEAELTYQSYCRTAGYLFAKHEAIIVEIPTIHQIYERKNPAH